jgi:hypothetical protein
MAAEVMFANLCLNRLFAGEPAWGQGCFIVVPFALQASFFASSRPVRIGPHAALRLRRRRL